jgi:hypothetical protein
MARAAVEVSISANGTPELSAAYLNRSDRLASDQPTLPGKPSIEEQRVVVMGADRGPIKLVVEGVLQTDACIEPRPDWRGARHERNIGDLCDPSVAVRHARSGRGAATGQISIPARITRAPGVEILAGEHDPVVASVGERGLQSKRIELISRIRAGEHGAGIKLLMFMNVAAAQREPVILALVLILRVEADVGELVR